MNRFFSSIISLGFLALLIASCGNDDLKNVNTVSSKKISFSRERTLGAEIIYSDSAVVKARGTAPILDKITPSTGGAYQEMIKGVKIDFFNPQGKLDGTLTADYAIKKDAEQITTFKKNVVVKNAEGSTFSSQELIWDETKKIFYSSDFVDIKGVDGSSTRAKGFKAPEDFSTYEMGAGSAELNTKEGLLP